MTLHQKILNEIEGRIVSGEWQPGFRLPFEVDLAVHYGCSRMTVNKVMTQLAKAGLIERHRKSGSFVSQPRAQSAILEIHDVEAEVRSLGLPYAYELLSQKLQPANAEDQRLMEISSGTSMVRVLALHHAGGKPFCTEERLINASIVTEAAQEDFSSTPPGPWLISKVPWTTAEHRIGAVSASTTTARLLQKPKGASCLVIERRTWSPAGAITFVRFTYPSERHTLVARFTPAQGESSK
jgi:GntR family histidine utilization transcriptional repressor